MIEVDESTFEEQVLKASKEQPVIVDFYADWCQPCKMLTPVLERLIGQRNGEVILAKVDVDKNQSLAGYFEIESIPAVRAFRDAQLVLQFDGLLDESQLNQFLDQLKPSEADTLVKQAASLEESDSTNAESLYRKALELDNDHARAKVGLARTLLSQGKVDEIESILEPIGPEGEIGEEAQRILSQLKLKSLESAGGDETALRQQVESDPKNAQVRYELGCQLGAAGKHEEALQMLLSAAELDYSLASSTVREAMVQIFYSLGTNHPLADEYRSKLARLLY